MIDRASQLAYAAVEQCARLPTFTAPETPVLRRAHAYFATKPLIKPRPYRDAYSQRREAFIDRIIATLLLARHRRYFRDTSRLYLRRLPRTARRKPPTRASSVKRR